MTHEPLSRDRLQTVLACAGHATNSTGSASPITLLVAAKRALIGRATNISNATLAATVRSRAPNSLSAPASNAQPRLKIP